MIKLLKKTPKFWKQLNMTSNGAFLSEELTTSHRRSGTDETTRPNMTPITGGGNRVVNADTCAQT